MDRRQRSHVVGVGEGLADGDVLDAGDGDDVAWAGLFGREALEGPGLQELGDPHVRVRSVVAHPRDRLALLDAAVEDAEQGDATEEGRSVEVRHPRLQRRLVVVGRSGNMLQDGLEERLEVVGVGELPVVGLVVRGAAGLARRVDHRHVEDRIEVEIGHVVGEVGREAEEQVLALGDHVVDAGIGAVGLVDEQDHGQTRLERLAQHEAGLRQRALRGVDQEHDAVDHREAPLDLAAEVGVTGRVDDVDGDRAGCRVLAVVLDGGVLREDRDALLALELVRVHGSLVDVRVLRERVGLLEHCVDEGRLAVVDVSDDRHVPEVCTGGDRHVSLVLGLQFRELARFATSTLLDGIRHRNGTDEALGVGVFGRAEDLIAGALFHQLTPMHHRDPVSERVDDGEVVADEQARELQAGLEFLQELEESCLHRHVERTRGLIGDQQIGMERECSGDADALLLAARQLVREAVDVTRGQFDLLEQLLHPALERLPLGLAGQEDRLADGFTDRHARVEARRRVLEDDPGFAPQGTKVSSPSRTRCRHRRR